MTAEDRWLLVTIVGGGFVGLPLAAYLAADCGVRVTVVDVRDRAEAIARVHEPGLAEAIAEAGDRLQFVRMGTPEATAALGMGLLTVLCLPTPSDFYGRCDTSLVEQAAVDWHDTANAGILAIKSTVIPGTTKGIARRLANRESSIGPRAHAYTGDVEKRVVFWPEFMAEGTAMADLRNPVRTVLGWADPSGGIIAEPIRRLFGRIATRNLAYTDATTAEGTKYASNVMLAARLTAANEVARAIASAGGDGREAVRLAGQDPRIGSQYLRPEAGWGGSCFPKDVRALARAGAPFATAILEANENHARWIRSTILDAAAKMDIEAPKIVVLGTSFKAGTDDERTCVHINVLTKMVAEGAIADRYQVQFVRPGGAWEDDVAGADIVILGTDWPEFVDADRWFKLLARLDGQVIIDPRGALPGIVVGASRVCVAQFGRPLPAALAGRSEA